MSLADDIRAKLDRGELPGRRPRKVLAGFGFRETCAGCPDPIQPAQAHYEVDLEGAGAVSFHLGCFGLWDAELRRRAILPE
jgi:hypothetical protein